jgi:carboxymethylenebutenolidase
LPACWRKAVGGLPLPKRAPQRQAYRLVELARWSRHLGVPMNVQPRFFPVDGTAASLLITAVAERDGAASAMALTGRIMTACWAGERDIADSQTLAELLAACGLPEARLAESAERGRYDAHTQEAIDAGVFGAPTYVIGGEMFWGQDRLDFVARKLGVG